MEVCRCFLLYQKYLLSTLSNVTDKRDKQSPFITNSSICTLLHSVFMSQIGSKYPVSDSE